MRAEPDADRFAERVVEGLDDGGAKERVVVWIEWRHDGSWGVGRTIDPDHRPSPGREQFVFEGYELGDALEHANEALEDEVRVLEEEGVEVRVAPFTRQEIVPKLERRFLHGA
ncbi:MAG TPA: hypothetical protein VFR32_00145 [Gaiellaceae bacterium]|nr:hypothetical protein [Gaiellaceae bacterium]